MDFSISADHRVKVKENEKRDEYLDLARKLKKKLWNMKLMVISIVISALYQKIGIGVRGFGYKRTSWNHPKYSIAEIGQNSKKSSGELRRLAVSHTPVENHYVKLVWKLIKRV